MESPRRSPFLILLAYIGFISLGLPDAVIGVAWPTVRAAFFLPQDAVGLVFLASGAGYFLSSFFSGALTERLGIGLLLAASTGLVGAALFGFGFAPWWSLFVGCALLHGLGSGAIDSGLNGFAAHNFSARHMNWLHACYCFGAMLGPLLMTAVLSAQAASEDAPDVFAYRTGYVLIGGVMSALCLVFLATWPRWGRPTAHHEATAPRLSAWQTLRHAAVLLQMAVFFLYTGLEVTLGQWAFTVLTESRGVSPMPAGIAVGVYWGSIGVGRVIFGLFADRLNLDRLLRICLLATAAAAALFVLSLPDPAAFAALALAGIGLAPVFPCLMTRTPRRLGSALSAHAVGFQVGCAMIGAAALPALLGVIAAQAGLEAVPIGAVALAVVLWLFHEVLLRVPDADPVPATEAAKQGFI